MIEGELFFISLSLLLSHNRGVTALLLLLSLDVVYVGVTVVDVYIHLGLSCGVGTRGGR